MSEMAVREYDAKLDSKKRITLRNAIFDYFHVSEKIGRASCRERV